MKKYTKIICPFCTSQNIAKILYGLPDLSSKELQKELDSGKTVLGGCLVDDNFPLYHCNDCGRDWGGRGSDVEME